VPEEPRSFPQRQFAPPPGALDLLLVRHGQSATFVPGAPFRLVDGHGDPDLSPEGREQAERVGERLAGEGVQAIYVSTLVRTTQTAAPLARRTGIMPRVEPDLREVFLGAWEGGLFRQRVAEGDPVAVRMREEERWDVIPGAEPMDGFGARVRAAVERLAAAHPGERVAAFTHGGVIGEVLRQASRSRPFAFAAAENASISQVVVDGPRWLVRRYNDTAHFTPGFSTSSSPLT